MNTLNTLCDTEAWAAEVKLMQAGSSTCSRCGTVVPQEKGFATADTGFMCFKCYAGGE